MEFPSGPEFTFALDGQGADGENTGGRAQTPGAGSYRRVRE